MGFSSFGMMRCLILLISAEVITSAILKDVKTSDVKISDVNITDVSARMKRQARRWRSDERCGRNFPNFADGGPAECNPYGMKPCCSNWHYCGNTHEHCDCPTCKRYSPRPVQVMWRFDGRCGPHWRVNGMPGQCNPDSRDPCCSEYGWCGHQSKHCNCPTCIDYRHV